MNRYFDLDINILTIKRSIEIMKNEKDNILEKAIIKRITMTLHREYNKRVNSRQRKYYIKSTLRKIHKELYSYLVYYNKYDHEILELYMLLDKYFCNY